MTKQYAIFTFRDSGPLKTWAAVRGAQVHNSREKPIAHAVTNVRPRHFIGSGNLTYDIQSRLMEHGIDPTRLRKNGVIAYEAVLTASPAFFEQWGVPTGAQQIRHWMDAQKAFLIEKYGEHRVVSLALHLDESTPHYHAVVLPLMHRPDGRSGGKMQWALVGRSISGPGQFDQLQNEYARAMEPFGLARGEVKSGQKHKPVKDYLAELKAEEEVNAKRATELEAMLSRARDDMAAAEQDKLEAAKERRLLAEYRTKLLARRDELAEERKLFQADCHQSDKMFDALDNSRVRAVDFLARVREFPQSQWTEQALLMSRSAEGMIQTHADVHAAVGDFAVQKAWLAERAGRGR